MKVESLINTLCGKILVSLWLGILASVLGLLIIGHLQGELLGYFAFSMLVAAILLDISIIFAFVVKGYAQKIVKIGWIMFCISVLVFSLLISIQHASSALSDSDVFLSYAMSILSFPLSLLAFYIIWGISIFQHMYSNSYILLIETWIIFLLVGYVQWFKLVPFFINKFYK